MILYLGIFNKHKKKKPLAFERIVLQKLKVKRK